MPDADTQAWLRGVFARWGLPERMRVDNGWPWGQSHDVPTPLALWLIGLGITMVWNHPHRPHENGKIERFNGLIDQWGEPAQCADFSAWQARLAWVVHMQRERYPAVHGQSRAQAFPDLQRCPRPFDPAAEVAHWQFDRVTAFLATLRWERVVTRSGQVELCAQRFSVGRAHAGQAVHLRFDPLLIDWVVFDPLENEIARVSAKRISPDAICLLHHRRHR